MDTPTAMSSKAKHSRTTSNIKAACEECRNRKTKCDGGRPACSRCINRNKHCVYDAEPDEYRSATMRRKCKVFEQRALAGERLLSAMRDLPESEALDILRRLRAQKSIESVAASLAEPGSSNDRESSPSVMGSHSSAASAAPTHSAIEDFARSRKSEQQQRDANPHGADAEMSDHRPPSDQRLAISFLVGAAAVSQSDASQQRELPRNMNSQAAASIPSILRMASYPPMATAAIQANRRASTPMPFVIAGTQAIAEGEGSRAPPDLGTMQSAGQASEPGADWDQYFTNVSSLLRRIGESSHGASQ
ncbi:hypothetical protein BST61_g2547 [Cercospora zeina]